MAPRRGARPRRRGQEVKYHITSSRAGCMLYLYGDSGTTYLYIHLNNDLGKTNDNRGRCAPGLRSRRVSRAACRRRRSDRFRRRLGRRKRDRTAPPLRDAPRDARPSVHSRPSTRRGDSSSPRRAAARPRFGSRGARSQQPEAFKVRVNSLAVRATGLKLNGISRPVSLGVETYTLIETCRGRARWQRARGGVDGDRARDPRRAAPAGGTSTAERILLSSR